MEIGGKFPAFILVLLNHRKK